LAHIFVSHASEDKLQRVRPIVEVLVDEGEPIWIDRPGAGEGNFGFDQAYISINDIDFLSSGNSWSDSILSALRSSGAVLGCLSKALVGQRDVIIGELTVAASMGKLVTCIVDDLDHSELPRLTLGLLQADRMQAPRLDVQLLRKALDHRRQTGCSVADLPQSLRAEWEQVRNLIASIDRVRTEPRRMRMGDIERVAPRLRDMPIGPPLKIHEVPLELIHAFGDFLNTPARVAAALNQANQLVRASTEDASLARKLTVRSGALRPIGATSGDGFWTDVFSLAGLKSRRTVAALVVHPVAEWALMHAQAEAVAEALLRRLESRVTQA
jgi:hypothetical protein